MSCCMRAVAATACPSRRAVEGDEAATGRLRQLLLVLRQLLLVLPHDSGARHCADDACGRPLSGAPAGQQRCVGRRGR
jgi:hypothetical protein